MNTAIEDRVLDAIEAVLAWDLPDECYPGAVTAHACMLAGVEPEDLPG